MKVILRYKYLSRARFNRYLLATGNNLVSAKRLYQANMRLAQAFHPLLSQFEVIFRNSLNEVLISNFSDSDWIINQKTGFMSHSSLRTSHFFLRTCLVKTERKLHLRGIPITSGKLIADQTFGFWVSFFLPHHYGLVSGSPIHVFPLKLASENRASIHAKLETIKNFRNRVNHCEPLCFSGHTIDCTEALEIRTVLYDLLDWINPELNKFFKDFDSIESNCNRISSI